jgi:lysozyme family protein
MLKNLIELLMRLMQSNRVQHSISLPDNSSDLMMERMPVDSKIIDEIIRREGGYVNHPADRGGPTNFGITFRTLGEARKLGRPATAVEVRELTVAEAREIYCDMYITQPKFYMIKDTAVRDFLIDFGVNSGPVRAIKTLQTLLGVTVDGVMGPQTAGAANQCNPEVLLYKLTTRRALFLLRLIGRDKRQAAFATGWANRVDEFVS